jgi:hypothetical protein
MNLHRELVQDSRQQGIASKPEPTGKKIAKHNNFVSFSGGNLLVKGSAAATSRKEPICLIFSDQICGDLGFAKDKGWRERL